MIRVLHGDCRKIMPTLEAESFDAIVTDPPGGISFMGKAWDGDRGGRDHWIAWMQGVASECLRVVKPGAHALVWALPRTSHWTATAWENAGWEVRDRVSHITGQGFPKSLNVSCAIDDHFFHEWLRAHPEHAVRLKMLKGEARKEVEDELRRAAGLERKVVGSKLGRPGMAKDGSNRRGGFDSAFGGLSTGILPTDVLAPATPEAAQWTGWGTSLKPAHEPWILCSKPLPVEAMCLTLLLDTVSIVFGEWGPWLRSNVSAGVAERALRSFLPQFARAAASIAPANVRMPCAVSSELVRLAELGFTPQRAGLHEESPFIVAESAAILLGDGLAQRTVIGEAARLRAEMDTFSSETGADTSWSIALSWSAILDGLFDVTRMCITETGFDPTTELTILNSVLIRAISASTIHANATRLSGKTLDVSTVESLLQSARVRLSLLGTTSAPGDALLPAGSKRMQLRSSPPLAKGLGEDGLDSRVACEDWWLLRKPLSERTVAANVLKYGCGALNIEACRIEARGRPLIEKKIGRPDVNGKTVFGSGLSPGSAYAGATDLGRWPANLCHDGSPEVLAAFAAFGESNRPNGRPDCKNVVYGQDRSIHGDHNGGIAPYNGGYLDSGSPARFFFSAKANADDRLGSKHPTVKPIDLMAWLLRLVVPPGGHVLDPFAGSGSTGMAAMREGFDATLIEMDADSVKDIQNRLAHVHGHDTPLFAAKEDAEQSTIDLFDGAA